MTSQTPWGVHRGILLAYYVLVLSVSGNVIAASEPLKGLLRIRGIFPDKTHHDRELLLTDVTNLGTSFSMFGAFVGGITNDVLGPKLTACMGQLCSALGFLLMFLSPADATLRISLGSALLGCTYACVSISHTSIAALFPLNATLAITALCAGNDISLGIPKLLAFVAGRTGITSCIIAYCSINVAICFIEVFLVPNRAFDSPVSPETASLNGTESAERLSSYEAVSSEKEPPAAETQLDMATAPLWYQMTTIHYCVLTLFICFSLFRRIHYSQLIRPIMEHIGSVTNDELTANSVVSWFERILPFTVIASSITGPFTNKFGVLPGMMLINTWGVILFGLCSFPIMAFQWVAIAMYLLFASFIFGFMYAFLGAYFGFATLGVLQGLLKVLCGLSGLLLTPWNRTVVSNLPDILWSNRILLVGGIVFYIAPLAVMMMRPRGVKKPQRRHLAEEAMAKRVSCTLRMTAGEFDRRSIDMVARASRLHVQKQGDSSGV